VGFREFELQATCENIRTLLADKKQLNAAQFDQRNQLLRTHRWIVQAITNRFTTPSYQWKQPFHSRSPRGAQVYRSTAITIPEICM